MQYAETIGRAIAHGVRESSLVVELDEPWPSLVVKDVKLPQGRSVWEVEQALCEELGMWNPELLCGVKEVRVMRRVDEVCGQRRGLVRIAFASERGREMVMRQGICAFGERCRVTQYRGRGAA
jgi:hypothetical protein